MPDRIAYIPLNTYPEAPSDAAILATIGLAETLGCEMHVATFAVDIPPVALPWGDFLINVEEMARAAEDRSKAECQRLRALIEAGAKGNRAIHFVHHQPVMGGALEAATVESRYFDLALVPCSSVSSQDMAQSLVFGSGLPVILVPQPAQFEQVHHLAIAWDGSHVAARALGDALRLLADGGRITVLTVQDEKALSSSGIAETLAASLELRGYVAKAMSLRLEGRSIAKALQDAAIEEGAQLLAMGGFGHSRLRDFVLGGATKGVLADLRIATLLAH
ncbi:universal stress protein [Paracoccus benzoatiresistens]|uniref:Universal stress protein n=1 Tax=Paracoccus benzoatiresistens TaxID=2997341 RepID=A0ABT4J8H1_9RHOB|nr:universal stress protein [Paracoccus sp. EF6]MCZ0963423.1 universal stress protein [Paracoccus sp. EF6]